MSALIERLSTATGQYAGEGAPGERFLLSIVSLAHENAALLSLRAEGDGVDPIEQEQLLIKPLAEGRIALFYFETGKATEVATRHELRREHPENGSDASYVFGIGTPENRNELRREIAIDFLAGGAVGYRKSAGIAGAEFMPMREIRFTRLAAGSASVSEKSPTD